MTRGFTLVELLVSMSIFAVISALVMVNFRAGERSDELRLGATTVSSFIRDAEARASSGVAACVCVGGAGPAPLCAPGRVCAGGTASDVVPLGGWGVHAAIGDASVVLFADLDGNRLMDPGESVKEDLIAPSRGVRVKSGGTDVTFVPPRPEIWINGAQGASEFSVVLEQLLNNTLREVRYNRISRRLESAPL